MKSIEIRKGNIKDSNEAINISRKLTDFFDSAAFEKMKKDFLVDDLYIAEKGKKIIGYCSIRYKKEFVAEITWLGILPNEHKMGYGRKLLEFIEKELKSNGIKILEVKTLDESANYEPYEKTRRFYKKCNFLHIETIDPYPEWGSGNPCAIYVKVL